MLKILLTLHILYFSVFKHVLNPRQKGLLGSPLSIVTALVDQIDFVGILRPDCDIRMSGVHYVLFAAIVLCSHVQVT